MKIKTIFRWPSVNCFEFEKRSATHSAVEKRVGLEILEYAARSIDRFGESFPLIEVNASPDNEFAMKSLFSVLDIRIT